MSQKFWAISGKKEAGPCDTREEAVKAFSAKYPATAKNFRLSVMTGYGNFGPHFDIRWLPAYE